MSSSLPSESASDMSVREFGVGTYDSDETAARDGGDDKPRSERNPKGKSLPDAGGSDVPTPEVFSSYPQSISSGLVVSDGRVLTMGELVLELADRIRGAAGILPGDSDAGTSHGHPGHGTTDVRVPSVSQSALPSDEKNPSSRSDYYDRMSIGLTGDEWADEDSGSYANSELPGTAENDVDADNGLGAWNGRTIEDQSNPPGHPSPDYKIAAGAQMRKTATNHELVGQLAQDFIKAHGKKDLTRRHVMAFLTGSGQHQYLASDVIRCLKLRHSVFLKDVLDEFPAVKTASGLSLASVRDRLIELEAVYLARPDVANQLRRCAAAISCAIADVERASAGSKTV